MQRATEIEVSGKTLTVGPLTVGNLGEFVQWVRSEVIRSSSRAAVGVEDQSLRAEIVRASVREAAQLRLGDEVVESYAGSVEGTLRLLWLATARVDGKAPPLFDGFVRTVSGDMEGVRKAVEVVTTSTPFLTGNSAGGDGPEGTSSPPAA